MSNSNLETQLWAIADELRGNMDANEFKNYILGFIFYRYLSEKLEKSTEKALSKDNITFRQLEQDSKIYQYVEKLHNSLVMALMAITEKIMMEIMILIFIFFSFFSNITASSLELSATPTN